MLQKEVSSYFGDDNPAFCSVMNCFWFERKLFLNINFQKDLICHDGNKIFKAALKDISSSNHDESNKAQTWIILELINKVTGKTFDANLQTSIVDLLSNMWESYFSKNLVIKVFFRNLIRQYLKIWFRMS